MTVKLNAVILPYEHFQSANKVLNELLPVDYFLAKELTLAVVSHIEDKLNNSDVDTVFHLVVALSQALRQGHSCLPIHTVANICFGKACDEEGNVTHQGFHFSNEKTLTELLSSLMLTPNDQQLLVFSSRALYLKRYYQFEQEVQQTLLKRTRTHDNYSLADIEATLAELFPSAQTPTDAEQREIDWQKVAVANALNKNFTVIAGGPGTGKTYTVTKLLAAIVRLHQKQQAQIPANSQTTHAETMPLNFALVAPTGKAAQRLSESITNAVTQFQGQIAQDVLAAIPTQAQTIHRLLGFIPNKLDFKHQQDNRLALDFLLVDEASMVDLALFTRLLRALPEHCQMVLLGDADQLPSVALGSILADIAPRPHSGFSKTNQAYLKQVSHFSLAVAKKSPLDHLTFLQRSRRFDGEGGIGQLAKAVIAGEVNTSWHLLQQAQAGQIPELDFQPLATKPYTSTNLAKQLIPYFTQYYLPLFTCDSIKQAFELLAKFRVLTPTRVGGQGIEQINQYCREFLIAQGVISKQQWFYHAMPIIVNENNHKLGIYNGDVGMLWQQENGSLMAVFEQLATAENNYQQIKTILPARLPKFEPVYAMTIHKTQGSEFEHVLMLTPDNAEHQLLSRELLYTGITRAKKQLTVFSEAAVWRQGVERAVSRYSNLSLNQTS